jgi:hypothetical protein
MINIIKLLDELSEEEFEMFEKDLRDGTIQRFIDRKKEFFKVKGKVCAVCGNIAEEDCLVLVFGEPSIRKKAHFCGTDCLEYFLNKYVKSKKPKVTRISQSRV